MDGKISLALFSALLVGVILAGCVSTPAPIPMEVRCLYEDQVVAGCVRTNETCACTLECRMNPSGGCDPKYCYSCPVVSPAATATAQATASPAVLAAAANANATAPAPQAPLANLSRNSRGDPKAAVTIIEFSDYQCPYCGTVEPTLMKLLADYAGKVKIYFANYPLYFHDYAEKAAEAAECAADEGKFWEMHDKLFANQDALDVASLNKYASEIGLDAGAFSSCLSSGDKSAAVQADLAEGKAMGVKGTPSFFINGKLLVGAKPYADFKAAVDAALQGG